MRRQIHKLAKSNFMTWLAATPAPKWVVLAADMAIVLFSCFLTYSFNAEVSVTSLGSIWIVYSIYLITYLFFSFIFKPFKYIVRLSVIEDVYRVALLCAASSVSLWIITLSTLLLTNVLYLRPWNVLTVGVFSFSMMMVVRLLLKYMFSQVSKANAVRKPVIMLGSAINSFVLASALKSEAEGSYNPVALLSLSDRKYNTTVSGIPIINFNKDTVLKVFQDYGCDTLLFLSTQLDLMRTEFSDIFINNHIKLMMLNQVGEFELNENDEPRLSGNVSNIRIEDLLGRETIKNDNPNIMSLIKNQCVMITGAAGSIGSEIVRQVARFEAGEIVLIDQAETPMHEMQLEMEEKFPDVKIHLFVGDITNRTRMERAFVKYHPRYVFHAAAYKHVPMMERNPSEAVITNVFGTKNLADLSVEHGVEKFVMISTDKAVNPTNIMGASKRIAEIYVQSLFFHCRKTIDGNTPRFITTRFGNVLGSNGSVIPRFRQQIEAGGPVTVTHRDIIRYFMTIPEACSLVLEAGCMGDGGEIYIFDMGKPVKIYDLAQRMISLAGYVPGRDIQIIETGLRPGEKLYEELLNDKEKTDSTRHSKIMIAKVITYKMDEVVANLDRLYELARQGKTHDMVMVMKQIVPEFVSQNSKYHEIDIELHHVEK